MFGMILGFIGSWISDDTPQTVIGDSIWVFLLSKNPFAIVLALGVVTFQIMILILFTYNSEVVLYEPNCNDDGEMECQEWSFEQSTRYMVFIVLLIWTYKDVMAGLHLIVSVFCVSPLATKAMRYMGARFRVLLLGTVSFGIGNVTLFSAFFHIIGSATSDLGAILDVVGILYVMDIDEAALATFSKTAPHWHARILDDINKEFTTGCNGKEVEEDIKVPPKQDTSQTFPPPGSSSAVSEQTRSLSVPRGRGAPFVGPGAGINRSNRNPTRGSLERGRNPQQQQGPRNTQHRSFSHPPHQQNDVAPARRASSLQAQRPPPNTDSGDSIGTRVFM